MNKTITSTPPIQNDEIDLFELCLTLWKNKYLIIAITCICTLSAALLAFIVIKPIYQATAQISPPYNYQINALNDGLILSNSNSNSNSKISLESIEANDVYQILIQNLLSANTQREFFLTHYIPKQINEAKQQTAQSNFENFKKNLIIRNIDKNNNIYSVSINQNNAQESYELVNESLDFANQKALKIILKNRQSDIATLISNTQNILNNLSFSLSIEVNNEISQLKAALSIAKSLNINNPMEQTPELYMQGTKALEGKLNFLEKQKENFSLNDQYLQLTSIINFYKNASLPIDSQITIFYTNESAAIPEKPIKPNKNLRGCPS